MNYLYKLKAEIDLIKTSVALYETSSGIFPQFLKDNFPTQEESESIQNIINNFSLDLEKQKDILIQQINTSWKNLLKLGWETSYGWKLGIDISDVALLNGAFTLAKEANNLGINNLISIVDTEGLSHELNFSDLTQLMLSYGQARSQLSNSYATKLNQIKNAISIEELNSIDTTI
jgi:hypothetical protein